MLPYTITLFVVFYDIQGLCFFKKGRNTMAGNELLNKTWCDKVFMHRNKDYGAYKIRGETGHRYRVALAVLSVMALIVAAPTVVVSIFLSAPVEFKDLGDKIQPMAGVEIKEARPVRRPVKRSEPETGDKDVNTADIAPIEDMVTVEQEEEVAVKEIEDLPMDSIDVLLKEKHLDTAQNEERTDGVIIDSIPHYPGGISCFMKWLDSTMVYPPACVRNKIEGTVVVAFIIDTSGHMNDPRIIRGAHRQLNNEALRTLHMMKPWKPAMKGGKPVRAQVTLPIVFGLN